MYHITVILSYLLALHTLHRIIAHIGSSECIFLYITSTLLTQTDTGIPFLLPLSVYLLLLYPFSDTQIISYGKTKCKINREEAGLSPPYPISHAFHSVAIQMTLLFFCLCLFLSFSVHLLGGFSCLNKDNEHMKKNEVNVRLLKSKPCTFIIFIFILEQFS